MKIGSKEYDEWLNNPLTMALKRSFEQAVTDPENQPSQYGTVTLAMYETLEAALREAREALIPYMQYVDGTTVPNHAAQTYDKINEVLGEKK